MNTPIHGRALAAKIFHEVQKDIKTLNSGPGLAVILVGNDPASHLYVRLKEKAAQAAGISFYKTLLPADTTQSTLNLTIKQFNNDPSVQAILLQMPLPSNLNEDEAVSKILPAKDVDGFHAVNRGLFLKGEATLTPPVIGAVLEALKATGQALAGKKAALLVNSQMFGQMLAAGLKTSGIESKIILPGEPENGLTEADIVVAARGQPRAIKAEKIKKGAILIDIGTTKVGSKFVGDLAPAALKKSSFYTPVPGGIGPLTVAMLMRNVVELAKKHE